MPSYPTVAVSIAEPSFIVVTTEITQSIGKYTSLAGEPSS